MKFSPKFFGIFFFINLFFVLLFLPLVFAQDSGIAIEDSILQKFPIDELVKLKKLLEQERERIIQEQERDRQRGVELSKDFLNKTREENANQDMILIRIAEYYIEEALNRYDEAVAEYNRKYEEYEKRLEAFQQGKLKIEPEPPKFPRKNYEEAIAIYDLILKNFPESDLADDALYNKAFLLKDMGENEASQAVFLEMIDKYPESEFIPEAYMQMAEFYFQPKLGQSRNETIRNLKKAAQLYKNVLEYKDSPRYDEALYKLGWTYYRLAATDPSYYNDAILYFTLVVQDIEKFKGIDKEGKFVKSEIEPEALQYLAASFVDTTYTQDGVAKAKAYIEKLGKPDFGIDILRHIGDIYGRIVDYDNSIRAYRSLLEMYPDYYRAPLIRKKMADVYLEAQKPELAYLERQALFEEYNPNTEWYANLEQSDLPDRILALDEATQLTEEALRLNLIYQLTVAREAEESGGDSLGAYNEFVRLGKIYLETYPTHKNAYEINWSLAFVLDTELKRYREAFEEYIRVSNDYLEDSHREDAANNAIVVAQTLVNLSKTTGDTAQIEGMDLSKLTAQELSEEEKLLAEAYDNYIKLFPNGEKTASYLANAGALYYQHRQYDMARKYYKTMVTRFPESQQKSVGLLSLMNSYFFLGKYLDAEFVAKKIISTEGVPVDQVKVAKKRIGESIYKNAERLEQEEKFMDAAKEFFRVYTDAPYYKEIVDLALFNSGRNYERAGEWLKAIQTYDTLIVNFPESQYRLIALGRVADAYKQLEDFVGVGRTYERIYQLYPDSKDAEAALYNASLFYARGEAWADAIRVNDIYIDRYPDNPDAKDLMFENARYYLKLNDLASANKIYDEFTRRYPNDSRTIEALYRRGEYYYEQDQPQLAKAEFQKAISKSEEFARTGRDPNLFYASEAYYKLGEIEYDEFKSIKLSYPESNLRTQLQKKKEKLLSVVNAFTKVIQMGSIRGFEAMYKVAEAYEVLADDIASQEIPPDLNPNEELVTRTKVFQASVPAYDRAVEEYKNVIKNIPVFAKKLEISLFDTSSTELRRKTLEDTLLVIRKEELQDTTRDVALKWYNRAKEKISLILYNVAERSSEFIDAYLRQETPAKGMIYLSWKKLLLEKAIQPAVNVTLNAHLKNIEISSQLGLENKYVTESKRKILLTSNIIADEYGKLVKRAVEIYQEQIPVLIELVKGGESATTPDGLNSLDFNDQMMSIIDYMNEFMTIALNQYKNTLEFAKMHNINNDAVLTTQDRLFNLAYENSVLMLDMAEQAAQKRDNFETLADSTGDPRYQLGIIYFDDQRSILRDYAQQALVASYDISKEYSIKNIWTNLILAKLVELDPAEYLGDIPKEKFIISTGKDWLVSTDFDLDWVKRDFDDSNWSLAVPVELPSNLFFSKFDSAGVNPISIWLVTTLPDSDSTMTTSQPEVLQSDTSKIDTGRTIHSLDLEDKEPLEEAFAEETALNSSLDTTVISNEPDTLTAYFRKHFSLKDRVINGWALITADDEYHFYLNGEYIKGDESAIFEQVDRVDFIEISDFLKVGENVIAIDVTDFDGPPRLGLRFYMELELLPVEITSAVERIRREAAESVYPERLKTVAILNKNKVLVQ